MVRCAYQHRIRIKTLEEIAKDKDQSVDDYKASLPVLVSSLLDEYGGSTLSALILQNGDARFIGDLYLEPHEYEVIGDE